MIPASARISRCHRRASTELADGETVLLNLEDGMYYGLNVVGSRVWELIQTPRTVREVQERLVEEFRVDPEQCARELQALLEDLANLSLIYLSRDR